LDIDSQRHGKPAALAGRLAVHQFGPRTTPAPSRHGATRAADLASTSKPQRADVMVCPFFLANRAREVSDAMRNISAFYSRKVAFDLDVVQAIPETVRQLAGS
jgi:hypothetical protein